MSMKKSQMGFSMYKSGIGNMDMRASKKAPMMMTSINNMMRMSKFNPVGGIQPKFKDR